MDDLKSINPNDSRGQKKVTKQLHLAHHDLERDKLMFGRSNNKLRNDIDQLESQQVTNLYSIKRDQHVLKKELEFVRNSSGYYKTGGKSLGVKEVNYKREESCRHRVPNSSRKTKLHKREPSKSRLPLLSKQPARQPAKVNRSSSEPVAVHVDRFADRSCNFKDSVEQIQSTSNTSVPQGTLSETKGIVPIDTQTKSLNKSEQTLHGPLYMNMDEARTNISNRLSSSVNELSSEKTNLNTDEPDLTPFMYAHPDGTPRTMFTMPSFQDRFQQAMHARYIRKPGTKLDPIDKELDLDEIFEKKK